MRLFRRLSLVALTCVMLLPGLILGPSEDAAVYTLIGQRVRFGALPYVDLFDNKPPGVYLVNALGQAALPFLSPWMVSWLISVLASAVAVLVFDRLVCRYAGPVAAWVWSALCCAGMAGYLTALGGGLTETYALLPLSIAIWIWATQAPTARWLATMGALLAAACLLSLQCAPVGVVAVVSYLWQKRGTDSLPAGLVCVLAGGLAVAGPILVWLWFGGMLPAAIEQILPYNDAYRVSGGGILARLPILIIYAGGTVLPVILGVGAVLRAKEPRDRLGLLATLWIFGMILYLIYENRLFPHYLIIVTPPVLLLCAIGLGSRSDAGPSASARVRKRPLGPDEELAPSTTSARRHPVLAPVAVALLVLGVVCATDLGFLAAQNEAHLRNSSKATATWLRNHASNGSRLFVWGYDPDLYLSGGVTPGSRYLYLFPLITPGFGSTARSAELLDQLKQDPPAFVVESNSAVPLNRPAGNVYDERNLDTLGPLREWVNGHYRLAASFGDSAGFDDVYVLDTQPGT